MWKLSIRRSSFDLLRKTTVSGQRSSMYETLLKSQLQTKVVHLYITRCEIIRHYGFLIVYIQSSQPTSEELLPKKTKTKTLQANQTSGANLKFVGKNRDKDTNWHDTTRGANRSRMWEFHRTTDPVSETSESEGKWSGRGEGGRGRAGARAGNWIISKETGIQQSPLFVNHV